MYSSYIVSQLRELTRHKMNARQTSSICIHTPNPAMGFTVSPLWSQISLGNDRGYNAVEKAPGEGWED